MTRTSSRGFQNRSEAGAQLAGDLWFRFSHLVDVVVLGLPRGGVPVAARVAERFGAPLDVMVVRKIGFPGQQQLAMGAMASGGVVIRNLSVVEEGVVDDLSFTSGVERARAELQALEAEFRGDRPMVTIADSNVVLVDDGLATGSTMKAAIEAVRMLKPASVIAAVPVAPRDTLAEIGRIADEVACLLVPERFVAVGVWYRSFPQVSTLEVRRLLQRFHRD